MSRTGFAGADAIVHDPNDPNPWYVLYLDQSTPLRDSVKEKWLFCCDCFSYRGRTVTQLSAP